MDKTKLEALLKRKKELEEKLRILKEKKQPQTKPNKKQRIDKDIRPKFNGCNAIFECECGNVLETNTLNPNIEVLVIDLINMEGNINCKECKKTHAKQKILKWEVVE